MGKKLVSKLESYYKGRESRSVYFYPIGLLYFRNREFDKAYQVLIEGLKYYPRYALALMLVGKILIEEKNYEAAIAYLETAVNIQPNNIQALELLAGCYENIKESNKALDIYEKLLLLEEKKEYKDKIIELASKVRPSGKLDLGKLAEEVSEDKDVPVIDLEDEEDKDSANTKEEDDVTITMAKLYEKQGYINDAIEVYKKLIEKDPSNVEARESLERLLKDTGLKDE